MDWKQLGLFKSARQRGAKPPAPKEFDLHCALADLLSRWIDPQWRFTHFPAGEKRDKITAARLQRMGLKPGWPDFIFVGPHREAFFLELKRHGETQTDEQELVALHLIACGFGYVCTDNMTEALAVLRHRGIVRARVSA